MGPELKLVSRFGVIYRKYNEVLIFLVLLLNWLYFLIICKLMCNKFPAFEVRKFCRIIRCQFENQIFFENIFSTSKPKLTNLARPFFTFLLNQSLHLSLAPNGFHFPDDEIIFIYLLSLFV